MAEHSFPALMPNSPLLLNYLCFGASFYSCILARACAIATATELVQNKAYKMVIRRKSFSVLLKIPCDKIQIFCDRSFAWFVNYFFAKCLENLTTRSLEIGWFLQKQSVSIFRASAHALHLTGFFRY